MIPKIIHYCWFGRNPKPKLAEKCIKSWMKYCPDYQIIEWNENNYDLSAAPLYVRQAYEAKRWAFVTDYVRLQVVYENGGIYMDTDVELRKPLDFLLDHQAYFGFEDDSFIATGLGFGAISGLPVMKEMMEDYRDISFVQEDGSYDIKPCPVRNTEILLRHGLKQNNTMQVLKDDILILPQDYLSPIDNRSGMRHITENTVSIHWFAASWCSEEQRKDQRDFQRRKRAEHRLKRLWSVVKRMLGDRAYEKVRLIIQRFVD